MTTAILPFISLFFGVALSQTDNFACPDEFEGYYPHLYSCDKYWECVNGEANLKTCGNGLAFSDLDETFTTENCDYIYNVDCRNRTELEPPISALNCPRLYGTFPDPEDCTAFYNCRNGLSDRFSCAPGLAYDRHDRVCKWADQVQECLPQKEEELQGFRCPKSIGAGLYSKHGHPEDCRLYYVCIAGVAREYGCPLGTVFDIGNNEFDGKCADPKDVPECANYYGDLDFDKQELVRAGVDPEAVGASVRPAARTRISRPTTKAPLALERPSTTFKPASFTRQGGLSRIRGGDRPTESAAAPPTSRPPSPVRTSQFRPAAAVPATASRPPRTTTPSISITTLAPEDFPSGKKPAKVKAGDDYYYYYYYYDEDELPEDGSTSEQPSQS